MPSAGRAGFAGLAGLAVRLGSTSLAASTALAALAGRAALAGFAARLGSTGLAARAALAGRTARTGRAALAALAGFAALALVLVPACGSDTDLHCEQSFLRYDNFGSPFIVNWCRACHSVQIPPGMRQEAPLDINFDTLDQVRAWAPRIQLTAGGGAAASMPPTGGPSTGERAMLVEWLRCGAR